MEHISHTLKDYFKILERRVANRKAIEAFEKNKEITCCELFKLFDYHDLVAHKGEQWQ